MRRSERWDWTGIAIAIVLAIAVSLVFGLWVAPAKAQQPPCAALGGIPITGLMETMEKRHQEVPRAMAWTGSGTLFIYINPETRAWSAFIFDPQNRCAKPIGAGEAWTDFDPRPVGEES